MRSESPGQFRLWFSLFIPWLFGTALAAVIGWLIVIWMVFRAGAYTWDQSGPAHQVVLWGAMGIIYGALIGLAQWVTLRNWLHHCGAWILATALGECVYWILSFASSENFTSIGRGSLIGLCGGFALGSAQWSVFRPELKHAWVWV